MIKMQLNGGQLTNNKIIVGNLDQPAHFEIPRSFWWHFDQKKALSIGDRTDPDCQIILYRNGIDF